MYEIFLQLFHPRHFVYIPKKLLMNKTCSMFNASLLDQLLEFVHFLQIRI